MHLESPSLPSSRVDFTVPEDSAREPYMELCDLDCGISSGDHACKGDAVDAADLELSVKTLSGQLVACWTESHHT